MTSFPSSIEVQLHAEGDAPIANMLVVLEVNHQGRYYYGTHLGLTDLRGRVHTAWENVAHDFAADRRTFVMDYRVPLDDCDPDAVVRVDGGQEFAARRTELLAELVPQSTISPTALFEWRNAANERITPAEDRVWLNRPDPDGVVRARLLIRTA